MLSTLITFLVGVVVGWVVPMSKIVALLNKK
jgi:hypothetical protein